MGLAILSVGPRRIGALALGGLVTLAASWFLVAASASAAVPVDGQWRGLSASDAPWAWDTMFRVSHNGTLVEAFEGGGFGPGGVFCEGGTVASRPLSAGVTNGSFAVAAETFAVTGTFVAPDQAAGTYSFPSHPGCPAQPWNAHLLTADQTATCFGQAATISGSGHLSGTAVADVIAGGDARDRIEGRGGNDLICAGKGSDKLQGGRGNDKLSGGPGRDLLNCGPGKDRALLGPRDKQRHCERVSR
jgi:hypothetical protein